MTGLRCPEVEAFGATTTDRAPPGGSVSPPNHHPYETVNVAVRERLRNSKGGLCEQFFDPAEQRHSGVRTLARCRNPTTIERYSLGAE